MQAQEKKKRCRKGGAVKTAIIGYSGSGKSTLARRIGEHDRAEVLHLDRVHFLPGWIERTRQEEQEIVKAFLDSRRDWVIDGNYSKLSYDRRMEEADRIILLLFNRFDCIRRVTKRYNAYKDMIRPDMAEGCSEKLDLEFAFWVLWKGRKKAARDRYRRVREKYPDKTVVIRNQKQLDNFLRELAGSPVRG